MQQLAQKLFMINYNGQNSCPTPKTNEQANKLDVTMKTKSSTEYQYFIDLHIKKI
uniref:Uncharacterized protein n=1 Tax=Arion vulgaris TaxID=1028688 RepID=A0A0B7AEU3_9EUPU